MPPGEKNNLLYDFLTRPGCRIGRHMLFIVLLLSIAVGQSFFVFEKNHELLGISFYLYLAGLAVFYIFLAYFNLYYLGPQFILKGRYVEYFIFAVATVAVFLIIKNTTEMQLLSSVGTTLNFNGITLLDNISNLTLNIICLSGGLVPVLFKQWIDDNERIASLENRRLKSNLDEIKGQLNPDFLFNTIAVASSKLKTNVPETSAILFRLSDVLRYELYDCKREKVLLKPDVEFINNYLLLEQQNACFPFNFSISTSGNMNQFVEPFLFMPVIKEIMKLKPSRLQLHFMSANGNVIFDCKTKGIDLRNCDFNEINQRLNNLNHDSILVKAQDEMLKLQLNYNV